MSLRALIAAGVLTFVWTAAAASADEPRYSAAVRDAVTALSPLTECRVESTTRFLCTYRVADPAAGAELEVKVVYSDESDTVYAYVPRFLSVPADAASAPRVLARLMELNLELLGPKLAWDRRSGEVRISTLLHTDSNFDRRAFRSLLRALEAAALRLRGELQRLAADAE